MLLLTALYDLVRRFLTGNDETTGQPLTKRQAGALILDELARRGGADQALTRRLVALAADWDAFHLAQDEYKARAVVQKARELAGVLAETDARDKAEREQAALDRAERERHAREEMFRTQSGLLLAQLTMPQPKASRTSAAFCFRTSSIGYSSCTESP